MGLPTTCVLHNIQKMRDLLNATGASERALKVEISGPKKNSVCVNYKYVLTVSLVFYNRLSCLYYERRMFVVALKHLERCKELASILVEVEANRRLCALSALRSKEFDAQLCKSSRNGTNSELSSNFMPVFDRQKMANNQERLEKINDDIAYISSMQTTYCTVTVSSKILPCLLSRFSNESTNECESWWTTVRNSNLLIWN